jgi:hypothetical protein
LIIGGGNPDLGPQKATTWTLGADFKPVSIAGLTAQLTYYDTVIKDELATPDSVLHNYLALTDENELIAPEAYQINPSAAVIQRWLAQPTYINPFNLDPSTIGAIIDDRYRNLSKYRTRGLDFDFSYKADFTGRKFETGIDGTYIFDFDRQVTSTSPVQSLLNTTYQPVDLKMRARVIVTQNLLTGGLYLNFTNSYSNTNFTPITRIPSWTTIDAFLTYVVHSSDHYFDGLSFSLNIINLTGRDPPFVKNSNVNYGTNYDAANGNPLSRFVSIRIAKRW